jgi:hypothetical protein
MKTLAILLSLLAGRALTKDQPSHATLHHRSYFYVGGTYVAQGNSSIMTDAMYVEHLTPQDVTQPLPLLIIHGNGKQIALIDHAGSEKSRYDWHQLSEHARRTTGLGRFLPQSRVRGRQDFVVIYFFLFLIS